MSGSPFVYQRRVLLLKNKKAMQLSKSDFMLFLKHPAWLWLKKYDKSKLPPVDAATQERFDAGNSFEDSVERMYPEGVTLGFDSYAEYLSLPERTQIALTNGAKTIFQGRFESGSLTCIVDILTRPTSDASELLEIKSSTQVWPEHIIDLAFQTIVLEGAGIQIQKISVAHANDTDVGSPVVFVDVTSEVRTEIPNTKLNIDKALKVISSKEMPDPSPQFASPIALKDWIQIYETLNIQ